MSSDYEPHEHSDSVPDPSESRERAHPKREPGLGNVDPPTRVRDDRDDNAKDSTHNSHKRGKMAGHDNRNDGDVVDPGDANAHGNRPDPADTPKVGSNE